MLNYSEMEMKYGAAIAQQCLFEIEKAARIQSWAMSGVDPETRLANALRIQDASSQSIMMHAA